MSQATCPKRIEPHFETENPKQAIELFYGKAKLEQGTNELSGNLTVEQQWSPTKLHWKFQGDNGSGNVSFGDVNIEAENLRFCGRLTSRGPNLLSGIAMDGCEVGTDHKLDSVTFHLANFPNLHSSVVHHEEIGGKSIRWSEIKLVADGWQILLQPHKKRAELSRESSFSQISVLSGLGEIRRIDGSQFKKKEAKRLIKALRIFISFAFAKWCPPLLVVGSNAKASKSWQYWTNDYVEPFWNLRGWLDEFHADNLVEAFPGFLDLWKNDNWQEPIELAVSWFIESSNRTSSIDGAIAHGQIPLEMLAWMKFVDDKEILPKEEFKNLSAATKFKMLFAACGIPFDVPVELGELSTLSAKEESTGPKLVTEVRNTIIHPSKDNREKIAKWVTKHGVSAQDIRSQTMLLYREYLTLVLLNLFGYRGQYARRLKFFPLADLKPVPWIAETQEFKIGEHVRTNITRLLDENKLTTEELTNLCDAEYSKQVFGLNYSLFKRSTKLEDRFDENGHARYYSRVYRGGFLLCSQWYERNRDLFDEWLAKLAKTEKTA